MRYYRVEITRKDGSTPKDAKGNPIGPYTSYVNGQTIQGGLNVELDFPLYNFDTPLGGAFLRIWGVGLWAVSQAANLNALNIKIFGGMQKGLPLANSQPAPGLILSGVIQQSFSNWQGSMQTLDLLIQGNYGTPTDIKDIAFNCTKGQQLLPSIVSALNVAFPDFKVDTSGMQTPLVWVEDIHSVYGSLNAFADFLYMISKRINTNPAYFGVKVTFKNGVFKVYDASQTTAPTAIKFTDLIGQPSWLNIATINFKTVLRPDLQVGDFITMPTKGTQTTTVQSNSQYRDQSVFKGKFMITTVRHLGNFRQADANSWVTVYDAVSMP